MCKEQILSAILRNYIWPNIFLAKYMVFIQHTLIHRHFVTFYGRTCGFCTGEANHYQGGSPLLIICLMACVGLHRMVSCYRYCTQVLGLYLFTECMIRYCINGGVIGRLWASPTLVCSFDNFVCACMRTYICVVHIHVCSVYHILFASKIQYNIRKFSVYIYTTYRIP